MNRPTANELNTKLAGGGIVQVSTHLRSTLYKEKHAGMFFEKDGNLYVKHGKHALCLSNANGLLVSVRTGRMEGK